MKNVLNRKELKAIKKDIINQLQNGVEIEDIIVKNWYYIGDGCFESIEDIFFDGKITSNEIQDDSLKVTKKSKLYLTIPLDFEEGIAVDFYLYCTLEGKNDNYISDNELISLNI